MTEAKCWQCIYGERKNEDGVQAARYKQRERAVVVGGPSGGLWVIETP
jgi:hypothetical protein